jgi:pimeloyl-ACP methyl ester carboxylesterase
MNARARETVVLGFHAEGAGDPTCVLIHGITLDRNDLRPLAEPLAATHSVVSVDLRGHGTSPSGSGWEIEDLAADVCALTDSLDLSGAVVIGHSLGGLVALAAAASAPDRFAGLVILDSTPAPQPEALGWLQGLSASIEGPDYATVWPEFCRTALFGYTASAGLRERVSAQMGAAAPELTRPLVRSFNDFAEHRGLDALRACDMPILMISSSSPTNDEHAIREAAPHTVFGQVVASGHFMHHEVPDQLHAMVEHFLSKCVPLPDFHRPATTGHST